MEGKTRHQLWMDLCDLVGEPQWFHPMESRHKNSPHEIQVMLIWILILQSISYHSLQYQEVWVYIVGICNLFYFPPLGCYSTILYSSTTVLLAITLLCVVEIWWELLIFRFAGLGWPVCWCSSPEVRFGHCHGLDLEGFFDKRRLRNLHPLPANHQTLSAVSLWYSSSERSKTWAPHCTKEWKVSWMAPAFRTCWPLLLLNGSKWFLSIRNHSKLFLKDNPQLHKARLQTISWTMKLKARSKSHQSCAKDTFLELHGRVDGVDVKKSTSTGDLLSNFR